MRLFEVKGQTLTEHMSCEQFLNLGFPVNSLIWSHSDMNENCVNLDQLDSDEAS